jgi:hydrogenase nickel incorporation protein HypA/HybF
MYLLWRPEFVIKSTRRRPVHELAAAQDALNVAVEAARAQQARRITVISLKVGRLYAIDRIESLITTLARGTIAEGARLEIEPVPGPGLAVESLEVE